MGDEVWRVIVKVCIPEEKHRCVCVSSIERKCLQCKKSARQRGSVIATCGAVTARKMMQ